MEKLRIMIKLTSLIQNWYLYPLVYYGLVKKEHIIFVMKNGMKIKLRTKSTDLMAFTHVWLIEEYSKPGFEIRDEDIIFDVGAHIGLFSLYASQFCKKGMIFCFEPIKENYDLLQSNLQLNNLKNVVPYNVAVSNKISAVTIFLNKDESGHSMYSPTSKSIQVESITLQKIFYDNNISKCDLLKLDCEGAEYDIVDTLSIHDINKINKMIIEYHFADSKPELLENLVKKLESISYKISKKVLFPDIGFLYVTKNDPTDIV